MGDIYISNCRKCWRWLHGVKPAAPPYINEVIPQSRAESQGSNDSGYNGNGDPHIYSDTARQVRVEEMVPLNTFNVSLDDATPSTSGSGEGSYPGAHYTIKPAYMTNLELINGRRLHNAVYTKNNKHDPKPDFFPKKMPESEPILHSAEPCNEDNDTYCPPAPSVLNKLGLADTKSTVNDLANSMQSGAESPGIPADEPNTSPKPTSPIRLVPDCGQDPYPQPKSTVADGSNVHENIPPTSSDGSYARGKMILHHFEDTDDNTSGAKSDTHYTWDSSEDESHPYYSGQVQRSAPQVLPSTENRDQIQNANHGNTNGANTNKTSNVMDLVVQVPKTNTDGVAPAQPEKYKDNADVLDTHDISPPTSAPSRLVTDGPNAGPSEMPKESHMQENDSESQKVADITEDVIVGSSGEQYEWDSSDDDSGGYKKRANNGIKEEYDEDEY